MIMIDRLGNAITHAKNLAYERDRATVCECCGRLARRVVVDHNHVSKVMRGTVCYSCNAAIGYAEWAHQSPAKFRQVMEYLRKYDPTHTLL
jgi:hypothetical protein